jgi:hypothetical protein
MHTGKMVAIDFIKATSEQRLMDPRGSAAMEERRLREAA